MSIPIQQSSRSASQIFFKSTRQTSCCCSRSKRSLIKHIQQRTLSSSSASLRLQQQQEQQHEEIKAVIEEIKTATPPPSSEQQPSSSTPRWSRTPPGMAAPFRARPYPQNYKTFPVNKDPKKLDDMYTKLLGKNGPNMLSDETKWLAVTHKSFDGGRRGFNERLAFLGKRILELQCSMGLVTNAQAQSTRRGAAAAATIDSYGRELFNHPAIDGIEVLTGKNKEMLVDHRQIARVAGMYGIPDVVRWLPRDVEDLGASGQHAVYAQAVLAIIGALSLEQGGAVASRVARERILQPSGMRTQVLPEPAQ